MAHYNPVSHTHTKENTPDVVPSVMRHVSHWGKRDKMLLLLEKVLQVDPHHQRALLATGYITGDLEVLTQLAKVPSLENVVRKAIIGVAIRWLWEALELEHSRQFLSGWRAKWVVRDQKLLEKALNVPGVKGKVNTDEILSWVFPCKESVQGDEMGNVVETWFYPSGSPDQKLADYLAPLRPPHPHPGWSDDIPVVDRDSHPEWTALVRGLQQKARQALGLDHD